MRQLKKTMPVSLLLLIASVGAMTFATLASANPPAARTAALHPILTPAAPVASPVLLYGDAIPDVGQSGPIPHLWFWALVTAGVMALIGLGYWLRQWLLHGEFFKMQPHEIALQYLGEACRLRDPDHTREYSYEVAHILRRYIEERFGIQKPLLPTEEFLCELTVSPTALPAAHRRLLTVFTEHYQLAKSAGWYYCRLDLEVMHLSAEEFVSQTTPGSQDAAPGRAANSGAKSEMPSHRRADESRR
jgi:hypothetical protein